MHPAQVPKAGFSATKLLQGFEETVTFEKFQEGRGFSTGQDQTVQEAGELSRFPDLNGLRAQPPREPGREPQNLPG